MSLMDQLMKPTTVDSLAKREGAGHLRRMVELYDDELVAGKIVPGWTADESRAHRRSYRDMHARALEIVEAMPYPERLAHEGRVIARELAVTYYSARRRGPQWFYDHSDTVGRKIRQFMPDALARAAAELGPCPNVPVACPAFTDDQIPF